VSAHAAIGPRTVAVRFPAVESDWVYAGVLGAVLAWIAVKANGGLRIDDTTAVEIAVDLIAGVVGAVALLVVAGTRRNRWGTIAAALFALMVTFTAISTVWSVVPDQSWIEANRLVTYLAVFAIGMAFVRLAPHRWAVVVGGITIACLVVSGWALLHKVFPAWLEPDEIYARLREPFGYWNAVGLMAALGVPGCLWLGARRAGHAAFNALAYPATALLLVVVLLAYSRGALLALVVGCGFWFAVVPLRLRGFAVLAVATAGAVPVIVWTFAQDALSKDKVPLDLRDQAGHQLGVAVLFMVAAVLAAGIALNFLVSRRSPRPESRRRAGLAILAALALIPVLGVAGLAASHRGIGGSISHGWDVLTNPDAKLPANDPSRLTAVGSVRARYWNDAFKITGDHPWIGVGSGGYDTARLHYRNDDLEVAHAHGYVVQTLADRGIIGLLLSLAALGALGIAVARATGLRRGGAMLRTTPERVGLLTLTTGIIIFGVHSFVDWTWFVPGVTIPALLAGGWLAGRGLLELPPRIPTRMLARLRAGLDSRVRLTAAVGAIALALCAAWAAWQPQRSIDAGDQALAALSSTPPQIGTARELARGAHQRDPVSVEPYFDQSVIETQAHDLAGAQHALAAAVRLQPANPATWLALATFRLTQLHQPRAAKRALAAALYLDPRSFEGIQLLIAVNRAIASGHS
jgi:hypothetical protein